MRSARVQAHFQSMDVSPQQKARQPVRECTRTLNHGCGSSSNGSCRDDLALGARSDASTKQITGPPLRLRGRPLLMAAIRHDLVIHVHTTAASGPPRSLEQSLVLCLFSSMADRSGHPIHRDTVLPQVARLVFSPKEPAELGGSSLRRRLVLYF